MTSSVILLIVVIWFLAGIAIGIPLGKIINRGTRDNDEEDL